MLPCGNLLVPPHSKAEVLLLHQRILEEAIHCAAHGLCAGDFLGCAEAGEGAKLFLGKINDGSHTEASYDVIIHHSTEFPTIAQMAVGRGPHRVGDH